MRITQKIQEAKETKTEFLMYSFTQNRCPPNTQDKFTLKLILVYTFSSRYPIGWLWWKAENLLNQLEKL